MNPKERVGSMTGTEAAAACGEEGGESSMLEKTEEEARAKFCNGRFIFEKKKRMKWDEVG